MWAFAILFSIISLAFHKVFPSGCVLCLFEFTNVHPFPCAKFCCHKFQLVVILHWFVVAGPRIMGLLFISSASNNDRRLCAIVKKNLANHRFLTFSSAFSVLLSFWIYYPGKHPSILAVIIRGFLLPYLWISLTLRY